MKLWSLVIFLFAGWQLSAQNTFKGTLQYRMVSFPEQDKVESNKMDLQFGVGKYLAFFPDVKEEEGVKKEQKVLVNTQTNIAYILDEKKMRYSMDKPKENNRWKLSKLDSSKQYLQKKADCYLLEENEFFKAYGWFSDDMNMECGDKPCITGDAPFMVEGRIPLIIEMYNKGEKMIGIYATDIIEAKPGDTALFSLANYTPEVEENTDSVAPKAPMEDITDTVVGSEKNNFSVITDQELKNIEDSLKKLSLPERKQLLDELEKSMQTMEGLSNEDKLKLKKFIASVRNTMKTTTKPSTDPPKKEN